MCECKCSLSLTRSKNGKLKVNLKKYEAEYHDANSYAKDIRQGYIEHFQMEPGEFYGELIQVVSEHVIVSTHSMKRKVLQTGTGKEGFTTFLLPGNMQQDFSWRSLRLTGKRIGVLKDRMAHFALLPSNFYGTPISLSNDYFNELILKQDVDKSLFKIIQEKEAIEIHKEDAYEIQKLVVGLCNSTQIDPNILIHELPVMMLNAIARVADKIPAQISNSRDLILSKSLMFINSNIDRPIRMADLCNHTKMSERNLRYIFRELVGLSPIKFVKNLKLNKVRKDLFNIPPHTEINVIANKWGFSHSGQFAADYKRLFGEYPSETMKKPETQPNSKT